MPREYRPRHEKFDPRECPLKWVLPKAYTYECEKCGNEFRMDNEIHIPWCPDCRTKQLEGLLIQGDPYRKAVIRERYIRENEYKPRMAKVIDRATWKDQRYVWIGLFFGTMFLTSWYITPDLPMLLLGLCGVGMFLLSLISCYRRLGYMSDEVAFEMAWTSGVGDDE